MGVPHISTNNWGSLKILYTHPQNLGITLEIFRFPENCTSVLKSHTRHPSVTLAPNITKTNQHWVNHLQTLYTH